MSVFLFTDLDKIISQSSNEAFGPVTGDIDHQFQVTNKFRLRAGAVAYTPITGTIFVQSVNNDPSSPLVNIAIKSNETLSYLPTPINFIIFRGIKKSSLITTDDALVSSGTNDLATLVWRNWHKAQSRPDHDNSTAPSIATIGFGVLGSNPVNLPLWHFFGENAHGLQLPTLRAGKSIGIFDDASAIGIDIILNDSLIQPKLSLLHRDSNIISVAQGTHSVYNQTYDVKLKREEVLGYMDLALFYSLNAYNGIGYHQQGVTSIARGNNSVYNTILTHFAGKNNIYLDIRNETSKSLNHYNEYLDENDPSGTTPLFYLSATGAAPGPFAATWPWPLFILTPSSSPLIKLAFKTDRKTFTDQNNNVITLKWNPDPLIYREFGELTSDFEKIHGKNAKFISLYNGGYNGALISKNIEFSLPMAQISGGNMSVNICAALKVMVLHRTIPNALANPSFAPSRINYLDNIFGPINYLQNRSSHETYAKRWMCMSDEESKSILGTIVQPSRVFTSDQVIFKAEVIDSYASTALGINTGNGIEFSRFGEDVKANTAINTFGVGPIGHAWEVSELGTEMRRVVTATASSTGLNIITPVSTSSDKPAGAMSLVLTRTEYDRLVQIADNNFDLQLGDIFCFFSPFTLELEVTTGTYSLTQQVYSSTVRLGGITPGGLYTKLDDSTMAINLRVFSLDGLHFNSATSGQNSTIELFSPPIEDYSTVDFVSDLREIEREYSTSDLRIDQTVTRVRVHHYGYIYEDVPVSSDDTSVINSVMAKAAGYGKGYFFNLNIPNSDYWEMTPGQTTSCFLGDLGYIPPSSSDGDNDACRVRQLYFSNTLSLQLIRRVGRKPLSDIVNSYAYVNGRLKDATVIIDPGNNIVDIGHTLYTFDALFKYPIPGRDSTNVPSDGYSRLGITDSVFLANFIGDITGTLGVAYHKYYNIFKQNLPQFLSQYPLQDFIAQQYNVTSPMPDLNSNADGYGLYHVWEEVFGKDQSVKLSDVVEYYYNNTSDIERSYRKRWKIFCLRAGLVKSQADGSYRWLPDLAQLRTIMDAGYQVGYLAEAAQKTIGSYLASGGGGTMGEGLISRAYLDYVTINLDPDDRDFVLNKFLNQIKGLLQAEQPIWNIQY